MRPRLFVAASALLFVWSVPAGFTQDAAAGTPLERLLQTAGSMSPNPTQLKEAYLALQAERLAGKAPVPAPAKGSRRDGGNAAPLSADDLAKLEAWFKAKPEFREKFLLALDPFDDNLPEAARVALALREKYPKESDTLSSLVVAFATVWDTPWVIQAITIQGVPELYKLRPEPAPYLDSFGWYAKHQDTLCPWFKTTPWRLLVYLAAEGVSLEERDWAAKKYKFSPTLGTVYSEVQYDYSKLKDGVGRIGGHPYTVENVLKFGGVCRDQAYYARAVCRAFGLPAYMATGHGNTTGAGHAWVGWVTRDAQGFHLQSHGRYAFDKFFTAAIVDPTSGKQILDYLVGIEAKGLSSEKTYDEADLYYRVWHEVGAKLETPARTKLLVEALTRNAFHREAWLALGEATASGEFPQTSADKQWQYLMTQFKEYPDFTFNMAQSFSKMFKAAPDKYRFYEATAKTFADLKRQDLVAKLRLEEIAMCEAENRKDLAGQVAMLGMVECAGEGEQGVLLAKKAVDLMRAEKKEAALAGPLKAALAKTPQKRIDEVNLHWVAIAELLSALNKDLGDAKSAAALDAQLDRLAPNRGKEKKE
jgi:hypothetical protein